MLSYRWHFSGLRIEDRWHFCGLSCRNTHVISMYYSVGRYITFQWTALYEDRSHFSGQSRMKTHGNPVDYISCSRIGDIYISYPDVRIDDISLHYPASAIWLYPAAENFALDAISPSLQIDESNATYFTSILHQSNSKTFHFLPCVCILGSPYILEGERTRWYDI